MPRLEITIPTAAVGKARHRSTVLMRDGRPVIGKGGRPIMTEYSDKKTAEFERLVGYFAQREMRRAGLLSPLACPVVMSWVAYWKPPTSWSKRKQVDAVQHAQRRCMKPDHDNISKAIGDALNGVVWVDDVQVDMDRQRRLYGEEDRLDIVIEWDEERKA